MAKKRNLIEGCTQEDLDFIETKMTKRVPPTTYQKKQQALNYKINLKCRNEKQKEFIKMFDEGKELIFSTGSAGCGKTYLAVAQALKLLKDENNSYEKIYLVTSAVQSEENIGLLPGSCDEKLMLPMMSFLMVIDELIGKPSRELLFEQGLIEFMPISYLRGVNLKTCITIGDELQNLSIRGMKTLLTRLSYDNLTIILGDPDQIDHPKLNKNNSGLTHIIKKIKESPDNRIGLIEFNESHIVRNPIIKKLLTYYD